ncbi:chromate resistance protein ChrB domain-containing protein [Ralstonia solanacearum]|uniref:chromate resistance protein ChrB domain-containing protein n=1 Tax=Ralstonia solanacearum TaxID=305 RepID=UPI001FF8D81B|nr:chromate resistance protein ChrB domain-containing protein [Ralstonia solanacearum]MDB0568707.1 chromate resistance protein [Ralstonia solanacearum]MDB0578612.1 chromate resistance protein [Ralstonia solanacearum]
MTAASDSWLLLIVSLPTTSATARMRIWRAVKTLGCVALRDGVYLLPAHAEQAKQLRDLADGALQEDGRAWVLRVRAEDPAEDVAYRAMFDRTADYVDWLAQLSDARKTLSDLPAAERSRLQRRHARAYEAIRNIDFFPNEASVRADAQWRDFAAAIEAVQSPGEPHAAAGGIPRRDPAQYRGRLWATRRHLWVDRVASAWLIQRFIDPHARFVWLSSAAECPADALGFDFDGATFTHIDNRVSFEVLLASFGLDDNHGLARLGAVVHALDVGGSTAPEAGGFEAILAGARKRLADDDALLAEIGTVLDSLYAHFSGSRKP